jgi:elongation factor 3
MKQTRILSEKDREQMDKRVDLGDGNGPRQIEALVGRAKYKKTFQYEMYVPPPTVLFPPISY